MPKPTKTTTPSKRGGTRPGAGARLRDPSAGHRVPITIKVAPVTIATLRAHSTTGVLSQSQIIDQAVEVWVAARLRFER